jgi:hypothetical protein
MAVLLELVRHLMKGLNSCKENNLVQPASSVFDAVKKVGMWGFERHGMWRDFELFSLHRRCLFRVR